MKQRRTFTLQILGIAEQDQAHLFQEFHQLDTSVAKLFQGAGLGLALTKRIVEAQGGRVGLESEPGVGNTIFAILPRGKAETRNEATSMIGAYPTNDR